MKKSLSLLMALLLVPAFTLTANAAKKEKKEKTQYVWDWDGTRSGNADFDLYLLTCDSVWYETLAFADAYGTYTYHQDTFTVADKVYIMAYMTDDNGNLVTRGQSNWVITQSVMDATLISLRATNISLQTASATLALPSLGLNSLLFAKYVKAGPAITARVTKEIVTLAKVNKANGRSFSAMKKGSIDPATLGVFSDDAVKKMKRCCYIKEIVSTDPSYTIVITTQEGKSEDELSQEIAAINSSWENSEVLPEDESKSLDDIDNIDDLEI